MGDFVAGTGFLSSCSQPALHLRNSFLLISELEACGSSGPAFKAAPLQQGVHRCT
jgi:hypothetical protein